MKEIKFRVWDELEKRMWYFGLGDMIVRTIYNYTEWEKLPKMQYIGREDKNGVEVYESDMVDMMVEVNYGGGEMNGAPDNIEIDYYSGEIIYNEELSRFGVNDKANGFIDLIDSNEVILEVLGNIYENEVSNE